MRKQNEIIKELRTERNISQQSLAMGITTRESVSNFERRGTNITSNTLIEFLDKMNVSLEEYYYLLNDKNLTQKQKTFVDGAKYFGDIKEQKKYLKMLESMYMSTNDSAYLLITSQYRLLYSMKNNDSKTNELKDDIENIKNHLNNVYNWGRFELSLFTNVLFIFNSEYIYSTYRRVIKDMKLYSNHPYYKDNIGIFIKNCLILFWKRKHYTQMEYLLLELDILSKNVTYTNERFTYLIFKKVLSSQGEFDISMIEPEIEILKYMGYNDYAQQIIHSFT